MSAPQSAPSFGSWPIPGTALTIDCSLKVIEQIRTAAVSGFMQLSRGGMEVAGILLGEHSEHATRILSWRPMFCEHARGPAFLLTDKDKTELASLLKSLTEESSGGGSRPLGWFISHTKGLAAPTEADLDIYREFFPESWQITLVLKSARDGTAQARFFVRDSQGQVTGIPKDAFSVSALRDLHGKTVEPSPPARAIPPPASRAAKTPAVHKRIDSRHAARRALLDHRIYIWLAPALLALVVLGTMLDRDSASRKAGGKPVSLGLRATDANGVLRIEWDARSEALRGAARASLDIKDGQSSVPIALDADRVRQGYYNYSRKSADLELHMTAFPANGAPIREFTKFVGAPSAPHLSNEAAAALGRERDKLKLEVQELRESLRKENVRNRQLEDTVRILKQRVQVEKLLAPTTR